MEHLDGEEAHNCVIKLVDSCSSPLVIFLVVEPVWIGIKKALIGAFILKMR